MSTICFETQHDQLPQVHPNCENAKHVLAFALHVLFGTVTRCGSSRTVVGLQFHELKPKQRVVMARISNWTARVFNCFWLPSRGGPQNRNSIANATRFCACGCFARQMRACLPSCIVSKKRPAASPTQPPQHLRSGPPPPPPPSGQCPYLDAFFF